MKRILFATLFTLIATTFSFAQSPTPAPQLSRVQHITLNPGVRVEWMKFYQTEMLPALKKGGVKQSIVLQVTQGDLRQFSIITPLASFAELDEPSALNKALGQEAAQALTTKASRFYAEWRSSILVGRPEMGIAPTSTEPAKLAIATRLTITPGRTAEYEKAFKENFLPAAKKTNVKGVLVAKMVTGGDTDEYRRLLLFDSHADMVKYQTDYTKAIAELKLTPAAPAGIIAHHESLIVRFVPELSIRPEPQKAANK